MPSFHSVYSLELTSWQAICYNVYRCINEKTKNMKDISKYLQSQQFTWQVQLTRIFRVATYFSNALSKLKFIKEMKFFLSDNHIFQGKFSYLGLFICAESSFWFLLPIFDDLPNS